MATVKMNREVLANVLDKISVDAGFSERLESDPVKTLAEAGIVVSAKAARELAGKRLSEVVRFDPLGPRANVAVDVAVDVAVGVVVKVAIETKARPPRGSEVINPAIKKQLLRTIESRINAVQKSLTA